jgi:hypothetical protein
MAAEPLRLKWVAAHEASFGYETELAKYREKEAAYLALCGELAAGASAEACKVAYGIVQDGLDLSAIATVRPPCGTNTVAFQGLRVLSFIVPEALIVASWLTAEMWMWAGVLPVAYVVGRLLYSRADDARIQAELDESIRTKWLWTRVRGLAKLLKFSRYWYVSAELVRMLEKRYINEQMQRQAN